MLPAQVSYWNLQEAKRHNIADEGIRSRSNDLTARRISNEEATLAETKRYNDVQKDLRSRELDIKQEANDIGWQNAAAQTKQANVAVTNATTRQDELDQKKREWRDGGKDLTQAKTRQANAAWELMPSQRVLNYANVGRATSASVGDLLKPLGSIMAAIAGGG